MLPGKKWYFDMKDILLKHCTLAGNLQDILLSGGKIAEIAEEIKTTAYTLNLSGKTVLPGMIDPHTHIRDLEQAYKEDWVSASQAALAGGVTTVFDMPNSVPPTVDLEGFKAKIRVAEKSIINYKFFIGANKNLWNIREIVQYNPELVAGIKLFLSQSSTNPVIKDRTFLSEILHLAKELNLIVVVHTEMQDCLDSWAAKGINPSIENHNLLRNRECAIKGTLLMLELTNTIKNKLYLAHVSTTEEVDLIRAYKSDNQIYCEITPHHLLLSELEISNFGNFGKVNPPLRTEKDKKNLWQAISDGTVDTVGSDHAPHSITEKMQNYTKAPSGFPGLETSFSLLYNEMIKGNLTEKRLVELTSANSAAIFDLKNRGCIKEGMIADLVIIDPEKSWEIKAENFKSKAKYSPFEGKIIQGKVDYTIIGGEIKYQGVIS